MRKLRTKKYTMQNERRGGNRERSFFISCFLLLTVSLALPSISRAAEENWPGVDRTVIERVAEDAGRPPADPLFPAAEGDLLLFMFLVAGTIGGFIAGYAFRSLFPPKRSLAEGHAPRT